MGKQNSFEEQMFDYINNFVPANKRVSWEQDAFFGIDFDATICDNDAVNLEVDFATVESVIALWKGEELDMAHFTKNKHLNQDAVSRIYNKAKQFVSPLSSDEKKRLDDVLARENILGDHLGNKAGKWALDQDEYNKAMAGKPINALLKYVAKEVGLYKDADAFNDFIDEKVVKRVEVASLSEIVPEVVKGPFDGWPDAWQVMDKAGIDYAIVTSSEYLRVIPLLESAGIGKYFGFGDKEYADYHNLQKQLTVYENALDGIEAKHKDDPYAEEIMNQKEKIFALKANFHKNIKNNPNLHLYSAAEEEFRVNEENLRRKFAAIRKHKENDTYKIGMDVDSEYEKAKEFKRKADGDIYGLAIAKEEEKRDKIYAFGIGIEDSGSIAAIKHERVYDGSNRTYGGDDAANGYKLAIGIVMASHYDVDKQTKKLYDGGADKVFCNVDDVKNFVISNDKKLKAERTLTDRDNQQSLATALAKYGNRAGR